MVMLNDPLKNRNNVDREKWIRSGGIYLPESVLRQPKRSVYLPVAEAITAEEVLGYKGDENKAIELCQSIYWKDCVLFISRIGALLEKHGSENIELQIKLSEQIFNGDTRDRVIELLKSSSRLAERSLFNNWQLLMVAKISLLFGNEDSNYKLEGKSGLGKLGDCFLVVNDLIGLGFGSESYENDTHTNEALIRNGSFFAREEAGNLLPRYYELFLELLKRDDMKKLPQYIDIEAAFRNATSFDIELFLAVGFGIYSFYAPAQDLNADKFVLNSSTFFKKTLVSDEVANKLLEYISISRDQFKEQYSAKYGKDNLGNYFDFTFFRQNPLISMGDGIYIPVDTRFLIERITSGIYWDIFDSLSGAEKDKFASYFGILFQKYLEELFCRAYPESKTTAKRVFYDVMYNGERSSDVMIFYEEQAVFIEIVVGRLRMEQTTITGDFDAFKEDIQTKIVDAAKQIDRVIKDFIIGKLSLPDSSPANIKRYFPVVITVSPLPVFLRTYDEVRSMVSDAGYLTSPNIAELEITNAGEMEMVESLLEAGHTLVRILERKTQDAFYKKIPLWHYLYATIDNQTLRKGGSHLNKQRQALFDKISPLLFASQNGDVNNT
jgi:hypothetical protein